LKAKTDISVELWQSVSTVYRTAIKRLNRRLSEDKISFSQFSILRAIGKFGPMPMSRLSEHMLVAPANITGLVDRLERKGYVERKRDSGDRRLFRIELTEKGRRTYETIAHQFWIYVRHVFSPLSDSERKLLLGLLARVRKSVEQIDILE
jgi:MarR family 2-MHQ and catechol resistance regulon transcriptional repressor